MRQAKDLGSHFGPFADVARARGVSAYQVCLAWELALSPAVVVIPGASRPESIRDSAAAASLLLTDDEVATLSDTRDVTVPAGTS
jgi:aryl-alcohol dehydrogenase-like predicted oxidoreductase